MTFSQELYKIILRARSYEEIEGQNSEYFTNEIIKLIEKTIGKVEKDYWKTLTPYLKKLSMTVTFPEEMDALNKVRKEIKK